MLSRLAATEAYLRELHTDDRLLHRVRQTVNRALDQVGVAQQLLMAQEHPL